MATISSIKKIIKACRDEGDMATAACWEAYAATQTRWSAFSLWQMVTVAGKWQARVVDVARNGIWVVRTATDAEFLRFGKDQVRERVAFKALA